MYNIKKYRQFVKHLQNIKYSIYLYYIRYNIYRANSTEDLIKIIKNISLKKEYTTTDAIFDILVDCFKKYPLTEKELQKISIWEQLYNLEGGERNYVTTSFWLCIIQSIQETEQEKLLLL